MKSSLLGPDRLTGTCIPVSSCVYLSRPPTQHTRPGALHFFDPGMRDGGSCPPPRKGQSHPQRTWSESLQGRALCAAGEFAVAFLRLPKGDEIQRQRRASSPPPNLPSKLQGGGGGRVLPPEASSPGSLHPDTASSSLAPLQLRTKVLLGRSRVSLHQPLQQ